jgi:uncharacterized protein (TIGR00661 family)
LDTIKRVLVCPLNWGLGHASRMIPVIYELVQQKYDLYIGADGHAMILLKQEFQGLKYIRFPSFSVTYAKGRLLTLRIILQIPKIIYGILKEHKELKRIISSYSIDLVISDNRYGLWNRKITTVFVTHQIFIKLPVFTRFLEPCIDRIIRYIILKYDQCWIPDFPDTYNNLTGDLSHSAKIPHNAKYIGVLSRFSMYNKNMRISGDYLYDLLVIISGPEPQRTILEKSISEKIRASDYKAFIIQGKPCERPSPYVSENITISPHLPASKLLDIINKSKFIICRSGYSTIMDLIVLKRTALLIPTPGQTEQEYLAGYLSDYFLAVNQNKIDLQNSVIKLAEFKPDCNNKIEKSLTEHIRSLTLSEKNTKESDSNKSQQKS